MMKIMFNFLIGFTLFALTLFTITLLMTLGLFSLSLNFWIEVEKTQKLYDFLLTVAHEMVHVKQTVRKQLTEKNLTHFWYGQRHTDRRNEPWELEAWKGTKMTAKKSAILLK